MQLIRMSIPSGAPFGDPVAVSDMRAWYRTHVWMRTQHGSCTIDSLVRGCVRRQYVIVSEYCKSAFSSAFSAGQARVPLLHWEDGLTCVKLIGRSTARSQEGVTI